MKEFFWLFCVVGVTLIWFSHINIDEEMISEETKNDVIGISSDLKEFSEIKEEFFDEEKVNDNKILTEEKINENNFLSDEVLLEQEITEKNIIEEEIIVEEKITHIKTPEHVSSLYFTAYWAITSSKRENLYNIVKNTEVNSVTIDIKTVSGYTSFDLNDNYFDSIKPISNWIISDIDSIIKELHEKNIYVVWRVVVFKDKLLSENRSDLAIKWSDNPSEVWTDYKGNKYLDPYSKEVWDYNINIASAAYELWFDEINFDYVRFPSDWYISKTSYPFSNTIISQNWNRGKIKVIDEFSSYLTSKLKEKHSDIVLSADVFWLITNVDLFQIWQNLESFLLYFDYVWPMIYPSHYAVWYLWAQVPDNIGYKIFMDSISKSNTRIDKLNADIIQATNSWTLLSIKDSFEPKVELSNLWEISKLKIRPWIQWFSCTRCSWATPYTRTKFREQIQAINDSWLNSRSVWNSASNYYSEWYGE